MKIASTDSTAPSTSGRITGTLHKRGYIPTVSRPEEDASKQKAEEKEVAGRHKNSGQKDHKGAR